MSEGINKIVLAYSGGLDTSVIFYWLKETYGCPVVAYAADLGQGEELSGIKEKALETGADEIVVEDLKEVFVSDYVWPAIRANAIYETTYMLGTSLARPNSSPLMKFDSRPKKSPMGATMATGSASEKIDSFRLRENQKVATITPSRPP